MNDQQEKNAMPWQNQENQFNPVETGGPQFNIEDKEPGKDSGKGLRGWLNKYGSSVILPIIALLILAGGIYLYANQKNQETELASPESANQEENLDFGQELLPETDQASQASAPVTEIVPEAKKEGGAIIEKAIKGDGVTHLARRALADYLKSNPQELTKEHKIYIEDYLKDKIVQEKKSLEVGEEISFSEDLIQEAISASQGLSASQLKTLESYSALVAW